MNVLSCDFLDSEGPSSFLRRSLHLQFLASQRLSSWGELVKGAPLGKAYRLSSLFHEERRQGLITHLNSVRCFPQNENFVVFLSGCSEDSILANHGGNFIRQACSEWKQVSLFFCKHWCGSPQGLVWHLKEALQEKHHGFKGMLFLAQNCQEAEQNTHWLHEKSQVICFSFY